MGFSLRGMLTGVAFISLVAGCWKLLGGEAVFLILVINLIGYGMGWVVTYPMGLPRDGQTQEEWRREREECRRQAQGWEVHSPPDTADS